MKKHLLNILLCSIIFYSCSTTETATDPDSQTPETPEEPEQQQKTVDFSTLLEPPQDWHHLDEEESQFRGISSQRAYENLLKGKSPKEEVVVAVIDGGVDIDHEDLKEVIWVNEDEIPNNQKDDDGNGYVDDVYGWNFIGGPDGKNVEHDTFELTRIYRDLHPQFSEIDTTMLSKEKREELEYYKEIRSAYEKEVKDLDQQYNNIQSLEQSMEQADAILMEHFGSASYSYEDIQNLEPTSQDMNFAKNVMSYVIENDIDSTVIAEQKKQVYQFAKYGYNPDYHTRQIVGDNYEDKTERYYGNNDVAGPDPSHGTHVAGIIAAVRDNGIGINGVATGTKIMPIRTVPNGDERDKDVANAIRYAVDNGADVINMSFGKSYSPHKEVVDQAVKHADEQGVLMVHGAGNSSKNTDKNKSYPTDVYESTSTSGDSVATLWIGVGATSWKPNEEFIATFSNYGDRTTDLFAPGVDIYSTMPDNKYERQDGTSMAAPVVSGTAALIMAYYPDLTPQQVRQIILDSSVKYSNQEVLVPNEGNNQGTPERRLFPELSASDGLVNVYNALQAAEELSSQ